MLDWLIEVTSAYKCGPRTYFLATKLFDKYLSARVGSVILDDSDVHLIGLGAIFTASKVEDAEPLSSQVLSRKVSHSAFSPEDILRMHRSILVELQFSLSFSTSIDFQSQIISVIGAAVPNNPEVMRKINDVATWVLLMSMQSTAFSGLREDQMAWNAILTAFILVGGSEVPRTILWHTVRESRVEEDWTMKLYAHVLGFDKW